ncbi:MAG TPA: cytochrome c biogenesis protein ResB [Terriglobales bacterium]
MALDVLSIPKKIYRTLANLRTGVVLLILVVIASALGTFVLQRPVTEPDKLQAAYSPQTLRLLDRLTLTDIFHSWWFLSLLALVSMSIIFVSIERFPNAWRFFARPYRKTDSHFRSANPYKLELPIRQADQGLNAAERALEKLRWPVERIVDNGDTSLYAEKNRFSVMAVYLIHASLLLIFLGGIIDGVFGFSGFMAIPQGEQRNVIELKNGKTKQLPFSVQCKSAGQENYADGSPKRWWSKLAVVESGKEIEAKEIVVNDPLVYHGLRFYQASYWIDNKKVDGLRIAYSGMESTLMPLELRFNQPVNLDSETTAKLVEFLPDAFVRDGQVFKKTENLGNLAFALEVTNRADNSTTKIWLFPAEGNVVGAENVKFQFKNPTSAKDIDFSPVTGLEISYEPGQWFVWAGCLLMGVGLFVAFYMVHMRIWAVEVRDAQGKLVLWIGGAANKNKDRFEQKFSEVVAEIRNELDKSTPTGRPSVQQHSEHPVLTMVGTK